MAAKLDLKIGSFDLNDLVEEFQHVLDTVLNMQTTPKRHGAVINDPPVLSPKKITMRGAIIDTTPLEARTILDNLQIALNSSSLLTGGLQNLTIFDDRISQVFKTKFTYSPIPGSAMTAYSFTVEFAAPGAFDVDAGADQSSIGLADSLGILGSPTKKITLVNTLATAFSYAVIQLTKQAGETDSTILDFQPGETILIRNLSLNDDIAPQSADINIQFLNVVPVALQTLKLEIDRQRIVDTNGNILYTVGPDQRPLNENIKVADTVWIPVRGQKDDEWIIFFNPSSSTPLAVLNFTIIWKRRFF